MLRIDYPDEIRHTRLRKEIDRDYTAFVGRLPDPLADLGRQLTTFTGVSEPGRLESIFDLNPLVVCPLLFRDSFPLDERAFTRISTAGCYLSVSYIVLDHLADGQVEQPELAADFQQALFERALALFQDQIEDSSPFWDVFSRRWQGLNEALNTEEKLSSNYCLVELKQFRSISSAKTTSLSIAIAGLAHAADRWELFGKADKSIREIGPAFQLWHDVFDWQKDFSSRRLTYFISEVIRRTAAKGGTPIENQVRVFQTGKGDLEFRRHIHQDQLQVEYLQLAAGWFDQALDFAQKADFAFWNQCVRRWKSDLDQTIFSINNPGYPDGRPLTMLQLLARLGSSGQKR